MKYFIITGTSRGIGEALAQALLHKQHYLFCISRNKNERLLAEAEQKGCQLEYFPFDLAKIEGIEELMQSIFATINWGDAEALFLVNNAGVVEPIRPLDTCSSADMLHNIHVNLSAPMVLIAQFIRLSATFSGEKRVLNISSGAGKHPYSGWSSYCSAKAGLDMLTRCVAVEQEQREYPVKVLSLAPGVVDTEMQAQIRQTKEEDFIHRERFIRLKEQEQLLSPHIVATKIVDMLLAADFEQGAIVDIRDFL